MLGTSKIVSISGKYDAGTHTYMPIFRGTGASPIISSFIFGEGLEEIGDCAFVGCSSLTLLTGMPKSCTKLGKKSFEGTGISTLAGISPNTVEIGTEAFKGCASLTTLQGSSANGTYVPGLERCTHVTTIAEGVFDSCPIEVIDGLPSSVSELRAAAFGNNVTITEIRLNYTGGVVKVPEGVDDDHNLDPFSLTSQQKALVKVTVPGSMLDAYTNDAYWSQFNVERGWFALIVEVGAGETVSGWGYLKCSEASEAESITINWGDGTSTNVALNAQYQAVIANITHEYESEGSYNISFAGDVEGIYAFNPAILKFSSGGRITAFWGTSQTKAIGAYCFFDTSVSSLVGMGNAVIELGAYAFSWCSYLQSLDGISPQLTGIGSHCFAYSGLTEISALCDLSLMQELPGYSFYHCTRLASLEGLSNITSFHSDGHTFHNCTSLTSLTGISDAITELPVYCFSDCTSLTSLDGMPDSISAIGANCFEGCTSLTSLNGLSPNIERLPDSAFYGCSGLTRVSLKSNIVSLGTDCFFGCPRIGVISISNATSVVTVPANNDPFSGITKANTYLVVPRALKDRYRADAYWGDFIIEEIPSIKISVFQSTTLSKCSGYLKTALPIDEVRIDMGNGTEHTLTSDENCIIDLSEIANQQYAAGTYDILLDGDIVEIGGDSENQCAIFVGDSQDVTISEVHLTHGIKTIGDYCFAGTNIQSLSNIFADSLGAHCFEGCGQLQSLEGMADNVTSLGEYCFAESSITTTVGLSDSMQSIADSCFYNCANLYYAILPNSDVELGSGVFSDCPNLLVVKIDGNTKVEVQSSTDPFDGLSADEKKRLTIIVPSAIAQTYKDDVYWGTFTFRQGCRFDLVSKDDNSETDAITFNGNATLVAHSSNSTDIYAKGVLIDWGDGVLMPINAGSDGNIALTYSHEYSDSIQSAVSVYLYGDFSELSPADNESFVYTENPITNVVLDEGVTRLGDGCFRAVFSNVYAASSVVLPSTLISGQNTTYAYCFKDCTSLLSIDFSGAQGVTTLGDECFRNCGLTSLSGLPPNLTTLGSECFAYCTMLTTLKDLPQSVSALPSSCFSGCARLAPIIDVPEAVTRLGGSCFAGINNAQTIKGIVLRCNNQVVAASTSADPFANDLTTGQKSAITVGVPRNLVDEYKADDYWKDFVITSIETTFTISVPEGGGTIKGAGYLKTGYDGSVTIDWGDGSAKTTVPVVANTNTSLAAYEHFYTAQTDTEYTITIADMISEIGGKYVSWEPIDTYSGIFYSSDSGSKISDFTLGGTITTLGNACFWGSGIESIRNGSLERVSKFGDYVFANSNSLNSIRGLPESITKIPFGAFAYCPKITSLAGMNNSVTSIGVYAFAYSGIETLVIEEMISLSFDAFEGAQLWHIYVSPDIVSSGCFSNCLNLKEVTEWAPSPVGSSFDGKLASGSFMHCSNLKFITFPPQVNGLKESVCRNCTSLKCVAVQNSSAKLTYPGRGLIAPFDGVTVSNVALCVPPNLVSAYKNDSYWSQFKVLEVPTITVTTTSANAVVQCNGYAKIGADKVLTTFAIDWGDGHCQTVPVPTETNTISLSGLSHTYETAGEYTIKFYSSDQIEEIGGANNLPILTIQNGSITSFELGGLTTIGDSCFASGINFSTTDLILPASISSLGDRSFAGFSNLSSLKLLYNGGIVSVSAGNDPFSGLSTAQKAAVLLYVPWAQAQNYFEDAYWSMFNIQAANITGLATQNVENSNGILYKYLNLEVQGTLLNLIEGMSISLICDGNTYSMTRTPDEGVISFYFPDAATGIEDDTPAIIEVSSRDGGSQTFSITVKEYTAIKPIITRFHQEGQSSDNVFSVSPNRVDIYGTGFENESMAIDLGLACYYLEESPNTAKYSFTRSKFTRDGNNHCICNGIGYPSGYPNDPTLATIEADSAANRIFLLVKKQQVFSQHFPAKFIST